MMQGSGLDSSPPPPPVGWGGVVEGCPPVGWGGGGPDKYTSQFCLWRGVLRSCSTPAHPNPPPPHQRGGAPRHPRSQEGGGAYVGGGRGPRTLDPGSYDIYIDVGQRTQIGRCSQINPQVRGDYAVSTRE